MYKRQEPKWFLGSDEYLKEIAKTVSIPCIRKDFTVDEYQIYQAKTLPAYQDIPDTSKSQPTAYCFAQLKQRTCLIWLNFTGKEFSRD